MLMGTRRKWLRGLPILRLMPVVANERSQNAMPPNTTKPSLQGLAASVAFPSGFARLPSTSLQRSKVRVIIVSDAMFTLSKSCALTTPVFLQVEVERALEPLAWDVERTETMTTYMIAPGRTSMFAPYSQARFGRQGDTWVLQLTLSRLLLVPFAIFALAAVVFLTMGPKSFVDVALFLALPFGIVGAAVFDCHRRLVRWWNLL